MGLCVEIRGCFRGRDLKGETLEILDACLGDMRF